MAEWFEGLLTLWIYSEFYFWAIFASLKVKESLSGLSLFWKLSYWECVASSPLGSYWSDSLFCLLSEFCSHWSFFYAFQPLEVALKRHRYLRIRLNSLMQSSCRFYILPRLDHFSPLSCSKLDHGVGEFFKGSMANRDYTKEVKGRDHFHVRCASIFTYSCSWTLDVPLLSTWN